MIEEIILLTLLLLIIGILGFLFFKNRNKKIKENKKPTLSTLKSYVKNAHNSLVEAANNLSKLYEVFNEIEKSSK